MMKYPMSWFQEAPHADEENPVDPETVVEYFPISAAKRYAARDGMYCRAQNLDLDLLTTVFNGIVLSVKSHQCYSKCGVNECDAASRDDCFCDGFYSGFDSEDSNAICGDVQMCQYICDQFEGCGSIDMHKTKPRCFLNLNTCNTHMDALQSDPLYAILFKIADDNDEQAGRKNPGKLGRQLNAPGSTPMGFSWNSMLRFKDLTFTTGGRFKLCFCDSAIHTSCIRPADYGVEIGEIHVSGVSCLVKNPRLQRVACTDQFHGGMRCYSDLDFAPMPVEPDPGMTELPSEDVITPLSLAQLCSALPIDEAEHNPDCAKILAEIYD